MAATIVDILPGSRTTTTELGAADRSIRNPELIELLTWFSGDIVER